MPLVMVLNDGETFTDLDGCTIVEVPEGSVEEVKDMGYPIIAELEEEVDDDVHIYTHPSRSGVVRKCYTFEGSFQKGS